MDSKIQNIVDKIYQDGLERAGHESEKILEDARFEAANLLEDAKKKSALIIQKAEQESRVIKEKTEAELRLAASRAVSELRKKIENSLSGVLLEEKIKNISFDEEFLKQMILVITENWKEDSGSADIDVLIPESLREKFNETIKSGIEESMAGLTIQFSDEMESGFQISKKGSGFFLDFTDAALIEFFKPFLHKKIAEYFMTDS